MKNKSIIDNTLHFLVHNGFLFTVSIMCLVHVVLLLMALIADVPPLIFFNILSVIVYLFCVILCKVGYIMPVYISILLEVTIYSAIGVYFIGWDSGSCNFLFSIVPIIIYFGCFLFKGPKRWLIVFLLALNFTLFVVLYTLFSKAVPVFVLTAPMRMTMMIFSTFVMVFSMIFYNTIYIYSSEGEMLSLEQQNEQLTVDANKDTLTQLLNRRGFLPRVKRLMEDTNEHFCIAFCDIDNFKRINDSYGHDCGDEVLRNISRTIEKELPECDVCRWGGEEIVILLKDYDFDTARQAMESLRTLIETTPTVFYNKRIHKTITIGLVEYQGDFESAEEIIKTADERMYYGKQHGKNIVIYKNVG